MIRSDVGITDCVAPVSVALYAFEPERVVLPTCFGASLSDRDANSFPVIT